MPRRIDVELTSRREDGTWTWRAAGARVPKGMVEGDVLPGEAKVGDVLRVEIETYIDGISIVAVLPPKSAKPEPQRIELLDRGPDQLVTTTLAPRGRGERRPRRDGDDRRGERDRGERDRGERRPRTGGPRDGGPREGGARDGGERRSPRPPAEPKARPKRLRPLRAHRREVVASLPEEQRPIAEELMRGGLPGVRAALDQQNEQARSEGRPEINPEPLMALAEGLWPRMRTAEWRDRAEAALADVEELDLRDLRSVVVAADSAARDDETRAMATQLREALNRRVDEEHTKWLTELAELVADGRVVAALRRSSRPPKAGAPLPSDLARLLADKTSEALHADIGVDRWAVLLDALSYSPVRTAVEPASVPESPSDELLAVVRKVSGRLPVIAARFGVEATAPPAPGRGGGRRPRGRPDRGDIRGGAPIPPPPPADAGAAPSGPAVGPRAEGEPQPMPEAAPGTGEAAAEPVAAEAEPGADQPAPAGEAAPVDEPGAADEPVSEEPAAAGGPAVDEPAPAREAADEPAPAVDAVDRAAPASEAAAGDEPGDASSDAEPANAEA